MLTFASAGGHVEDVDLRVAGAVGYEGDLARVRGEGRRGVHAVVLGEPCHRTVRDVLDEDVWVLLPREGHEHLVTVGREAAGYHVSPWSLDRALALPVPRSMRKRSGLLSL